MSFELQDSTLLRDQAFVAGQWIGAANGDVIAVTNPATGRAFAMVPSLSQSEVRTAIEAAERAQAEWMGRTGKERAAVLREWFELIRENREDLARILTAEQGKPLAEAMGEIDYAASYVEWFGEEAKRLYGDVIPGHQRDKRLFVLKQPIGVCAAITPWNFPSAMITRKVAPALAAGCALVLKPASQTPLSAFALCDLANRAGVPSGLFSCVTGPAKTIGEAFMTSSVVRKVSFTGSTEVGKELLRQSANTVKRTSMELGGNAPLIVFDDADLNDAIEGVIDAKFRNAGQTCVCANRIFVHKTIHDTFVERLAERTARLRVGDGCAPDTEIGPLIDEAAVKKLDALLSDAVAKGGTIAVGGSRHKLGGTYFEPTLLTGMTAEMEIFSEEIFGPVSTIIAFENIEEMVCQANATPFGLAAYLFGRDLSRVWRTVEALDFGIVGVNTGLISTELAPFGGVKESGHGREGARYGIDDYIDTKYVCLSL